MSLTESTDTDTVGKAVRQGGIRIPAASPLSNRDILLTFRECICLTYSANMQKYSSTVELATIHDKLAQAEKIATQKSVLVDGFIILSIREDEYAPFLCFFDDTFGRYYTEAGDNYCRVIEDVPLA